MGSHSAAPPPPAAGVRELLAGFLARSGFLIPFPFVSAATLALVTVHRSSQVLSQPSGISPVFWRLLVEESLAELTALDVGTGTGRVALALAPLCRRVLGVDRAVEAIVEAQRRAAELGISNVELVVADAEAIEYDAWRPELVVAHLCVSPRSCAGGLVLASGACWRSGVYTDSGGDGRASRFAYDEARRGGARTRGLSSRTGVSVGEDVRVGRGCLAAVLARGVQVAGRWFHYIKPRVGEGR